MPQFVDFLVLFRIMQWFALVPGLNCGFDARVSLVDELIAELKGVCAGLPDKRKGLRRDCDYTMADIGLSAFSIFFMGSPSFLAHQRALAEGHGGSNCETLFGISKIPSDNYVRLMLDGAAPAAFDGLSDATTFTKYVPSAPINTVPE